MKTTTLFLITISLLLQSCFSYKTINPETANLVVGKTYKIKQNKIFEKVKLKSFTDSTIIVRRTFKEKEILKSEILKMKQRKFSVIKTAVFIPVVVVVSAVGIFAATYKGPQIGGGIQMPP
ncbi:MAG: hypothetical protein H7174_13695 [Flavobacterium sp.]|nr:hypothetical protein [Flavobacterium sp.]